MTYTPLPEIVKTKEQNVGAFERIRTAHPYTLLEYKQTRSKNPLQIVEKLTGGATSTYNSTTSSTTLGVTTTGDKVTRQTLTKAVYQPGKSLAIIATGVLDFNSNTNCISRIGYFNDDRGYFFEFSDQIYIVERSGGSDTKVAAASWSEQPSYTFDVTKAQIFWFDMEWLGVGTVRAGIFDNGSEELIHKFHHNDIVTTSYMKNANLPIRYELESTGGAGELETICGNVTSDGGYEPRGFSFTANRGTDRESITTGNEEPILSMRIKAGSLEDSRVILRDFTLISTSSADMIIRIWFCPPGTNPLNTPSWTDVNDESCIQYDLTANTFTSTGCYEMVSRYASDQNDPSNVVKTDIRLGVDVDSTSAMIVMTAISLTNNESVAASFNWTEYY